MLRLRNTGNGEIIVLDRLRGLGIFLGKPMRSFWIHRFWLRSAGLAAWFASSLTLCHGVAAEGPGGKARHVVVVTWDGMRPDFVTPEDTPVLYHLAKQGVFFRANHSVYPSSTEVNGTVLATGLLPGHSGLVANVEYRPAINPLKPFPTQNLAAIQRADEMTGKYLAAPTLAEMLHDQGRK